MYLHVFYFYLHCIYTSVKKIHIFEIVKTYIHIHTKHTKHIHIIYMYIYIYTQMSRIEGPIPDYPMQYPIHSPFP